MNRIETPIGTIVIKKDSDKLNPRLFIDLSRPGFHEDLPLVTVEYRNGTIMTEVFCDGSDLCNGTTIKYENIDKFFELV